MSISEYIDLTYVAHVRNGCIFRRRTIFIYDPNGPEAKKEKAEIGGELYADGGLDAMENVLFNRI